MCRIAPTPVIQLIAELMAMPSIFALHDWFFDERTFSRLQDSGVFIHRTANHSLHFSDPITGVDTNKSEAAWNTLKLQIRSKNRIALGIDDHSFEFIWTRQNGDGICKVFFDVIVETH